MKASWLICSCLALLAQPLCGDTIYQTNSQGKEIVLQRDAIVIQQDSSLSSTSTSTSKSAASWW